MLNRTDFAKKTLYGAGIISHILKQAYPEDEVVMHIEGRDCGICRNPFDNGSCTLQVKIRKLHPEETLGPELAFYHDLSGTLPDGDAFDFAERYYGLKDQALLEHINKEMNLHIGEKIDFYAKEEVKLNPVLPQFSFYPKPIWNIVPSRLVTIREVYDYITGPEAKQATERLRSITDRKAARKFKEGNFDNVTFSGSFEERTNDKLIEASNLFCVDLDHLPDVEGTFQLLLKDPCFKTVLLFRSPSGDGIKWVIPIQYEGHTHEELFRAITTYLRVTYGLLNDENCKNISRACFLPYDPNAYVSPDYL